MSHFQTAIVGAGICGLAHAWMAARRGWRVIVLDRSRAAEGATIRNFGMIWPIGQPGGAPYETALRSRELWLELARQAGVWVNPCGSLHLAHRADEWEVLQEFLALPGVAQRECRLLTAAQVAETTPAANPAGLLGGMFSPTELCVQPRTAARQIASWLQTEYGVQFEWGVAVQQVDDAGVHSADGRTWSANRTVVCSGSDLSTLFPHVFASFGLRLCKLQMMKTVAQPHGWKMGPHVASGLTLRHYGCFAACKSLGALRERIATESPELDRFGIHVMASQNELGEVVLGDSHEYDEHIDPFRKARIDELMLRELQKVFQLPDWTISERWDGQHAKHPADAFFHARPLPTVDCFTGLGGAGMTLALGLADRFWNEQGGPS